MINVQIDDAFSISGLEDLIVHAAQTTILLNHINPEEVDLAVVLTGDDEIQRLNRQYLGNDAPTDVLSFPGGDIDPDTSHTNLGDIIISYPQADRQAKYRQGTVQSEIQLLVVHGILHIIGYDHADAESKIKMWTIQRQALSNLDLEYLNPS
jgi:probable rRNA maturation factor